MKSYLIRITTKEELRDWKEFTKLAKSKGLEIKEALFQLMRSGLPEKQEPKELELAEIKEELGTIKELIIRYNSPARIDSEKSFEPVEGKHRQHETESDTEDRKKLAEEINQLRGNISVQELCERSGINFIKQGLSRYSAKSLKAMLKEVKI